MKDVYTWLAIYSDDSSLAEYDDETPEGRGFAEVEQARVKELLLVPVDGSGMNIASVVIPAGATPVFFRRRRIEIAPGVDATAVNRAHCIGWKKDGSACYLFVFEDGSALLTDDLQAI